MIAASEIKSFIIGLLKQKSRLPEHFDDSYDFIQGGIVDSIGIIKFVLELEAQFDVEIADTDIESPRFRNVQGLTQIILHKLEQKGAL